MGLLDSFNNFGQKYTNLFNSPDFQRSLTMMTGLGSGEGVANTTSAANAAYQNALARKQNQKQQEALKTLQNQFPNNPLISAYPEIFAREYLQKQFSEKEKGFLGLDGTGGERQMSRLIQLGNKISNGTASPEEIQLYGMEYERAKKGTTTTETKADGSKVTYRYGQMSLFGLPVPTGYKDTEIISESEKVFTPANQLDAGFAKRMVLTENTINDLTSQGYQPETDLIATYAGGGLANVALSPQAQRFQQAALNFVTAQLRKESGAAISKEEFEDAYKTYFPRLGDSQEVIEQKRKLRKIALQNMINSSSGAFKSNNPDFDLNTLFSDVVSFPDLTTLSRTDLLALGRKIDTDLNSANPKYNNSHSKAIMAELERRKNQ